MQDLWEIDFELGESKTKEQQSGSIRNFINLEREYSGRWSPLKLDLLSQFLEIEVLDAEEVETFTPEVIFDMPALAYALVTLDLRHVPAERRDWKYGEDWAISFTLNRNL